MQILYHNHSGDSIALWLYCCSVAKLCLILQSHELKAHQVSLSFLIICGLLKLMSIELVMLSNHLLLCLPLLLLLSVFSSIRVFSHESAHHIRWSKYRSFSFSISPSNECSGLTSFRINWFDCLAVQGTLNSLLHSLVPQFESINSLALSLLCYWTFTSVTGLLEKS